MDRDYKKEKEAPIKKQYRSATITVVANGLTIGCQTVVAETPEKLKQLINDYLDDPIFPPKRGSMKNHKESPYEVIDRLEEDSPVAIRIQVIIIARGKHGRQNNRII